MVLRCLHAYPSLGHGELGLVPGAVVQGGAQDPHQPVPGHRVEPAEEGHHAGGVHGAQDEGELGQGVAGPLEHKLRVRILELLQPLRHHRNLANGQKRG